MVAQVGQRPAAKLFSTVGASLTHQEPAFHENPSIFRLSLLAPDQVTNYSFLNIVDTVAPTGLASMKMEESRA
ncbi:hypothetical protein HMPREF9575_00649 [Cutibacterium acnes HL110PA1]|nr:hypothetical protein HMPREF9575_00649 [Cutibacterium acnes HL110PA1]EGE99128.1 hypothetical protein HMPREF9584_02022 [Cutibacterium acnes HL092PA1]